MADIKELAYNNLPCFLQNFLVSWYGKKIKCERFNKEFERYFSLFEKTQYYSYDELVGYQEEQLQRLVKHAYKYVPYYNDLFKRNKLTPSDITSRADLHKIPVITKSDIKKNFSNLISTRHPLKELKKGHTSGTTGTPFELLWDRNIDLVNNTVLWRHRSWGGFEFGSKYATLFGRVIVPMRQQRPPFYRLNSPWNQFIFSSFHLTQKNMEFYFEEFDKQGIHYLEAYPSTAYILARYLDRQDLFYKMNAVFTSSETLLPLQRELIEKRFQCKVFDYYGSAERVMFSGECEAHEGHHLAMEYSVTEILGNDGAPLESGQYGRTVCTGLHNYGMPLLRYEIGDICSLQSKKCTCGRGHPLLGSITTKAEDIVVLSDGRLVSSSVLTHPFKPLDNIEKSQIIQEDYDQIIVKLVKRPGYEERDTQILLEGLKARLGDSVSISVEFVEDILPGANGKYRWVISKVPLSSGTEFITNLYDDV